jgi:hypothetical protein
MAESLYYDWSDEPTVPESFEDMRTHLLAMGAGERAIAGTVNTQDDGSFSAVYRVTDQPPRITQVQLTGHANVTATLRIVGIEGDAPTLTSGRFTYELPTDTEELYETVMGTTPTLDAPARAAEVFFDQIHEETFSFEPAAVPNAE